MKWNEISIKTNEQGIDVVCALLYDLNAGGVEILGGDLPESGDWDYIDDDLIKAYDIDGMIVKAYFADDHVFKDTLTSLKAGLEDLKKQDMFGELLILNKERDEQEWNENWKKYFKPFKAGEKIVVCPQWESYDVKDDEILLKIDPGAAFGSGLHETTKMCICELEKYVKEDTFLYDVGCGSGILAIAGIKLGAKKTIALDRDNVCVEVAGENFDINAVADYADVSQADLLNGVEKQKADIVVANIIADVIIRLNDDVKDYLKADGVYIMSGIIADRLDDVLASLDESGFEVINVRDMGEWRCVSAKIR